MKLLIVSQYFWPENFRINDLAVELVDRGYDVTVLTGWPNYPSGLIFKEFSANKKLFNNYKGIKIIRVPLVPRGVGTINLLINYLSFSVLACVVGPWKLIGRKFDLVLTCQLSPVTVGFVGALVAWIKKAPMIMWVLDLWPDSLNAIGVVKSPKLLACARIVVRLIYNQCDLLLVQSRWFIPKIRLILKKPVPIVYFPSWSEIIINNKIIKPAPEVSTNEGFFNVMFAGNVGEAQDFFCILSAADLLRNNKHIRFLIVGNGRMYLKVQAEIKLRNLSASVVLLGLYPLERMPEFFAHADAFLVTLLDREIFSMTIPGKIQSYLAAGKPILGALNGEGAEIIRLANAGLTCSAGDFKGLANIVLRMSMLSSFERQVLGENGFRYSEREFNRCKLVDLLESCFLNYTK